VSFNSNTTRVTSGAGTAYTSGAPGFTVVFLWGSCCSIFSFMSKGGQGTSYIRVFFIETFIMAEIFQPSDKIKLIFILF